MAPIHEVSLMEQKALRCSPPHAQKKSRDRVILRAPFQRRTCSNERRQGGVEEIDGENGILTSSHDGLIVWIR